MSSIFTVLRRLPNDANSRDWKILLWCWDVCFFALAKKCDCPNLKHVIILRKNQKNEPYGIIPGLHYVT